ncbi:MAG: S-layer homology domain-containing protein [Oscillospiraceae bacterium]|nr:S-layer homology domain-containing protein [Oscillospiraceae bacterium]
MNTKLKKILRKLALFVPLAVLPALLMMAIAAVSGTSLYIGGGYNGGSYGRLVEFNGDWPPNVASTPHAILIFTEDLELTDPMAVILGGDGGNGTSAPAPGPGGDATLAITGNFTAPGVNLTGGNGGNGGSGAGQNGENGGDAVLNLWPFKLDVKMVKLEGGDPGDEVSGNAGGDGGKAKLDVGTYFAAKDYGMVIEVPVEIDIDEFEFDLTGAAADDMLLFADGGLPLSNNGIKLTGTPDNLNMGDTIILIGGADGFFATKTTTYSGYTFDIYLNDSALIAEVVPSGGNQSSSPSPTPRPNYYPSAPEEDLHIDVTLERETLEWKIKVTGAGTKTVKVDAAIVPWKSLRGMQAAQTRGYEMVISLDVFVDGVKTDAPMTVCLPYTLKRGEDPKAVRIWHMDDNGNLADLKAVYNKETGMITFKINHQSFFVMGYEPVTLWTNRFNDIKGNEWYYDAVAYANCYGIFEGSDGNFMPTESMTRAMFAVMLWKLDGRPALVGRDTPGALSFDDVSPDMWYHGAVVWAAENGIASGDDLYYPESPITRQEMAVMLYNYMNFKGYEIPKYRTLPEFADKDEFDEWAEIPAKELAQAYVISGSGNRFRPLDTATRADVAKILENFLRFVAPPR